MWLIDLELGGVPREQKLLKGHLPRVIYHQVYKYTKIKRNSYLCPGVGVLGDQQPKPIMVFRISNTRFYLDCKGPNTKTFHWGFSDCMHGNVQLPEPHSLTPPHNVSPRSRIACTKTIALCTILSSHAHKDLQFTLCSSSHPIIMYREF